MNGILDINNLTIKYGKNTVVNNFNLSIKKGHICGLIGPNGAGKTTIMKFLAGLILPDDGYVKLFGDKDNLQDSRQRMSFMIEAPYIDGSMTAFENMQYIRFIKGVADEKRIEEVLEIVGLSHTENKPVRNFSLGMKQRLGIGMALLQNPEIMILDEPVNGLDPEGIVNIRNLLKRLCENDNVTILISSHLLSEMAELCTDFAIINHGKLIDSFSVQELKEKCENHITIKTNDINKTAAVLEEKLNIDKYRVIHGDELHIFELLDKIETVSKVITDNNIILTKLIIEGESLEEYYMSKVGDINE